MNDDDGWASLLFSNYVHMRSFDFREKSVL